MKADILLLRIALSIAILTHLILTAGCAARRVVPVIEPENSAETFTSIEQRGTAALWDEVWEAAVRDGKTRVGLLAHGDEALALRINLIRSASKSIKLQTFIWKDSEVMRLIAWELIRAIQQRGVRVQVLADHLLSVKDLETRTWKSMLDPRYEHRVYSPVAGKLAPSGLDYAWAGLTRFEELNGRMHNKLMIVDDRIAITGGRNIGNEYFDRVIGLNYKDLEVVAIGPTVEAAVRSFEEYWQSRRAVPSLQLKDVAQIAKEMTSEGIETRINRGDLQLNRLFETLDERASDADYIRDVFLNQLFAVQSVEWIADHPKKRDRERDEKLSETTRRIMRLLDEAEQEVLMQSPYLVLRRRGIRFVKQVRRRNPNLRIAISTNSLAAADTEPVYAMIYKQKRIHLQDLGIDLFEFRPIPHDIDDMMSYTRLLERRPTPYEARNLRAPRFRMDPALTEDQSTNAESASEQMQPQLNQYTKTPPYLCLHGKAIVVDDQIGCVGSFNLDPRSARINTEIMLVVHDPAFTAALRREIERDMAPQNSFLAAPFRGSLGFWGKVNEVPHRFFEIFPIDLWPIRYAGCFELKEGRIRVAPDDPSFYDRWENVGSFPVVRGLSGSPLRVRLFKTIGFFFLGQL